MPDSGFILPPAFRVATDAMDVVAGGTLEFYLAGTNTATNVYSDSTLSTSLGSVVYLDSGGHPVASSGSSTKVIVYTGASLIKIVVKDSDGATLATYDNVRCAQDTSALSGGGSDGGVEAVVSKTADYTVLVADDGKLLHCDPTGGPFTITLPSAVTAGDGFEIGIRHAGTTTTNTVKVASVSGQTIARAASTSTATTVKRGGETLRLVSNGATWVAYGDTGPDFNESPIRITDRLTEPPAAPTAGARYMINGTPTLGWASYAQHDIVEADGNGGWIRYRPYTDCGWLAYIADEDVLAQYRGTAWVDFDVSAPTASDLSFICVAYQLADGSNGGVAGTANTWTQRPLNTTIANTLPGASLTSNQITGVAAGTYLVVANAAFHRTGHVQIRVRAVSAGTFLYGVSAFAKDDATAEGNQSLQILGTLTLASSDTIELQDITSLTGTATNRGFASANTGMVETFAALTLINLASLQGPQGAQGPQGTNSLQSPLVSSLANGDNNNVAISSGGTTYNRLRVAGPTGAFAITGLAAPSGDGHQLEIYCTVSQTMTLKNGNASSTAANRILTMTGSDVALTGPSIARLTYDTTDARWHLVGTQG
jgi:hypothetical protein